MTVEPGAVCDSCGRRVPVPKEDRTPRRREQFNVAVPKDAENGREVLVTLVDAARERLRPQLGWDADVPSYFVLTAVLADWLGGR